jgi:hypothetical protein
VNEKLISKNPLVFLDLIIDFVARVRRRGDRPPISGKMECGLSGKYGETRNSCLLSVKYRLGVAT